MKPEKGFVLLASTIMLMLAALLMIGALEAFILEKKISDSHYQKSQSFYRAEAKIDETVYALKKGENPLGAELIKVDACNNRYYRINAVGSEGGIKTDLQAEYVFPSKNTLNDCVRLNYTEKELFWRE